MNEIAELLEKSEESLTRVIYRPEIYQIVGLGDAAIRRMERNGEFPQRVHIGRRKRGWRLIDVKRWLDSRQPVSASEAPDE